MLFYVISCKLRWQGSWVIYCKQVVRRILFAKWWKCCWVFWFKWLTSLDVWDRTVAVVIIHVDITTVWREEYFKRIDLFWELIRLIR